MYQFQSKFLPYVNIWNYDVASNSLSGQISKNSQKILESGHQFLNGPNCGELRGIINYNFIDCLLLPLITCNDSNSITNYFNVTAECRMVHK